MANTIKIKRSSVAGKIPTTAQLELGELAVNTTDGKLYTKKEVSGVASVVEIGAGGGGGGVSASSTILELPNTAIASNVVLGAGYNGLSVGPVEISAGYTVEVPANATWAVV